MNHLSNLKSWLQAWVVTICLWCIRKTNRQKHRVLAEILFLFSDEYHFHPGWREELYEQSAIHGKLLLSIRKILNEAGYRDGAPDRLVEKMAADLKKLKEQNHDS